jgi:glutamate-ammonia-ligase adenylyltransferase
MSDRSDELTTRAIQELPQGLQSNVVNWLQGLGPARLADAKAPLLPLVRLVACSEYAAATLLREWDWFVTHGQSFDTAPGRGELARFADEIARSHDDIATTKTVLRRFRHRFLLRVLWREIAGLATLEETLSALSDLADQLLRAATAVAEQGLHARYGRVRDARGDPVSLVVLGMGKLGGRELNFSSDIDLIFLYPEGRESDGERALSAQEYFARVARRIVALLDESTADGFVFRVDTRLRPFGESGPPVSSFAALESYLLQHGREWERYAYVKARIVGPRPPARVADELMRGLIQPFVYRRYLDFGVFESLREMHAMISAEVERRDMADNVKLGPGGIREIEFIVQSLQLVRGGSQPDLQNQGLLSVLPLLEGRKGLEAEQAGALSDAYEFLRRLENFIQAIRDRQTHALPTSDIDRDRLGLAMGYPDWASLADDLERHREAVSSQFRAVARKTAAPAGDQRIHRDLEALWGSKADKAAWAEGLDSLGFPSPDAIAAAVCAFSGASALRQIDATARARLDSFMPALLMAIKERREALTALQRVIAVVEKIVRRSAYIALLNENSDVLARLVELCERSSLIAQQIARHPVLLDELLDPRELQTRMSRNKLQEELEARLDAGPAEDSEARIDALGQFQRVSIFRVAVADFSGSLPIMRVSDVLTDLAETVLEYALAVAWDDMTAQHGRPFYEYQGLRRPAGFGIIGYGKLGGIELSYGSDLDLVFLHDSRGERQQTDGPKGLDNARFFSRLVRRLVHFLTTQTGSGALYEIDTRLRPDGHSGVLVSSTEAFERYQEENAWTWEHQALLRARPVAGSATVARMFEQIRAEALTSRVRGDTLRDDVVSMRQRMRNELDKSGDGMFDLKQGAGGIGDLEFIVQYLLLANAREHRSVIHYPDNIRQLSTLAACGCIEEETALRMQDIYRAYRLRLHHLTLAEATLLVSDREFVAERHDIQTFWQAVFGAPSA